MSVSSTRLPAMSSEKTDQKPTIYFRGSCACGRITYECTARPSNAQNCHCVTCRKISGSAYQPFADVPSKAITLYDKKEQLRYEGFPKDHMGGITYLRLSKTGERAFCVDCHSALAMRYQHRDDFAGLTLGTVDIESVADEDLRKALMPQMHIFVSQKAYWSKPEEDGLPFFERFSGDFEDGMKAWEMKSGFSFGPDGEKL